MSHSNEDCEFGPRVNAKHPSDYEFGPKAYDPEKMDEERFLKPRAKRHHSEPAEFDDRPEGEWDDADGYDLPVD